MLRSLRLSSIVAAVALALVACRDSGSTADDTPDIDASIDAPGTNGTTIQEVQSDTMVPGTPVELRGKVVVHIDTYGARVGNLYVMEPGGGEYSGVLVFGAPVEQVSDLVIGDLVDIVGAEKDEFGLETDDGTVTEVVPVTGGSMTVTKVGTGVVPQPHVLDLLALGQLPTAAREAEYEKWEGVLVRADNVSVIRGLQQIGSGPTADPDFRDFVVTGQMSVDSSFTAIPADPPLVVRDDCLASVTGLGDYFFNYKILPRMTSDIALGGTACPPIENTMALCGDNVDNDANGFTDCMDLGCRAISTCMTTTTVADIQSGTVPEGTNVTLSNVIVTARSFNNRSVWVADALQAAPNNGVLVFRATAAAVLPPEIVVGARVNVSGQVDEFPNNSSALTVTEIALSPIVTFVSAPAGAPTPVTGLTLPTLLNDTTGEPYEGVLIRLDNVRVTGPLGAGGTRPMAAGTTTFIADDDLHRLTEADNTCYASLIGVWHYNGFDLRWVFLPRGTVPGDIMTGGTCN